MSNEREARILAVMLHSLIASMSDPSRLTRGRTYAIQGAVEDLQVEPGELDAYVQGSRSAPYHVVVHVDPAERFDTRADLVPDRREVHCICSCPDSGDPCKHGVAVLVAFADLVLDDPAMLGLWRGQPPPGSAPRAVVGSRGGRSEPSAPAAPVAPEPAFDETAVAALADYLGHRRELALAPVSTVAPPNAPWGELWAEMLTDALEVLAEETIPPTP
ncbi:MAG: hypothetical protein JWM34_2179 [Ilumatobacteraceae bacterium]|nr:hypothetical protein [Ilumatobacteraceae bacterium]